MNSRVGRAFCWTLNNPGSISGEDIISIINNLKYHRYSIFQKEKGESGTEHYQGYTEFENPVAWTALKKLHTGIHVEQRRGTREEARDYCKKEDTQLEGPFEIGTWISGSGHRSDLLSLKKMVDNGSTLKELWDEHFITMVKYPKAVETYKRLCTGNRNSKPTVSLLVGTTGCGKSTLAREEAGTYWVKPPGTRWFDGYQGEENVIFDDFDPEWMTPSLLLNILDKWECTLETKGGHIAFLAKKIWITCNIDIRDWYPKCAERQRQALYRRVDRFVIFEDQDTRYETGTFAEYSKLWDTIMIVPVTFNNNSTY